MNSGYGTSSGQKDDINLRKLAVRNMLLSREYRPHLVMIQEFRRSWTEDDILYEEAGVETIRKYILVQKEDNKTTDVGILYDSETLEYQEVPISDIKNKLKMSSNQGDILGTLMKRMYVAKFVTGTQIKPTYKKARMERDERSAAEHEFFVISWHGPHKQLNDDERTNKKKGVMDDNTKKAWLYQLIDFAYSLKNEFFNGIPFIIGGDFNLSATKVKEWQKQKENASKSFYVIADAAVGSSKKDKDFIIISEGLMGTRCQWVSLDSLIRRPSRLLDHSPRYMEISLRPTEETTDATCVYRRTRPTDIPDWAVHLVEENERLKDEVKGLKGEVQTVYQRLQDFLEKQKHQ